MTETLIQAEEQIEFEQYIETSLEDDPRLILDKYGFVPMVEQVDFGKALVYLAEHEDRGDIIYKIATGEIEPFVFGFHSITPDGADKEGMKQLDDDAVAELSRQPGFIGYFVGEPDEETGVCLSWCIWESREAAHTALGNSPAHQRAMEAALGHYQTMAAEYMSLSIKDGEINLAYLSVPAEIWDKNVG